MRTSAPDHPLPVKDMTCVYNTECGKMKRSDAEGLSAAQKSISVKYISNKLYKLKNRQKVNARRSQQSMHHKKTA